MLSVNAYFEDQVMSIAFQGEKLATTVGVMSVGELPLAPANMKE
jgi:uncharacterized protein YaiE (UPF0345 family)